MPAYHAKKLILKIGFQVMKEGRFPQRGSIEAVYPQHDGRFLRRFDREQDAAGYRRYAGGFYPVQTEQESFHSGGRAGSQRIPAAAKANPAGQFVYYAVLHGVPAAAFFSFASA
jgi:hypothetical protein